LLFKRGYILHTVRISKKKNPKSNISCRRGSRKILHQYRIKRRSEKGVKGEKKIAKKERGDFR